MVSKIFHYASSTTCITVLASAQNNINTPPPQASDLATPPSLYHGGRELSRAAAALNRGLDTERNRQRHEAWNAASGDRVVW